MIFDKKKKCIFRETIYSSGKINEVSSLCLKSEILNRLYDCLYTIISSVHKLCCGAEVENDQRMYLSDILIIYITIKNTYTILFDIYSNIIPDAIRNYKMLLGN